MAKITWEFDSYEDKDELIILQNAHRLYSHLWDIDQELRARMKHGDISDNEDVFLERLRDLSSVVYEVDRQ